MSGTAHHTFETPEQLHAWLQAHHASETELWVRIFKKGTGQPIKFSPFPYFLCPLRFAMAA